MPRAGAGAPATLARTAPALGPRRAPGPGPVVAAIVPRAPIHPGCAAGAVRVAGQAAALADVFGHVSPDRRACWADGRPDGLRCTPRGLRLLARALVDAARAADLFPLLPTERLDEMDARLTPGQVPFYAWSIPFSDAYLYAHDRHGKAGPLERLLHALAMTPYIGVDEASADLEIAPSGPDDPLLPLLDLLEQGQEEAARASDLLRGAEAGRLFAWVGDPAPLIPDALAYMVRETGNEFLDWDESMWDNVQLYAEEDPYAWDEDIVDGYSALWRHTRVGLGEMGRLWAALADPRAVPRLARAIRQAAAGVRAGVAGGGAP